VRDLATLVTVYITNYNYGAYIEDAIKSVLSQDYFSVEVIIIDDGSTDSSHSVIEKYVDHENIKVVYQKNKGLTKTNNVALRLANGKYIVRLDADDRLKNDALTNLVNGFVNDNIAMVFGNWDVVDEHGNFIYSYKRHDFNNDVTLLDCPAHGACTMFRTEYLRKLGGYDEELRCQDGYELWFRVVDKFTVKSIDNIIFDYRRHGSNLTGNEERILSTRSNILKKISSKKTSDIHPFAFIPIRGSKLDSRSMPFEKVGNVFLIDLVLKEVVNSKLFEKVVVSTPDKNVADYLLINYAGCVHVDVRGISTSMINKGLDKVLIDFVNKNPSYNEFSHGVLFGVERPFNKKYLIESALDIAAIFEVDNVVAVRANDDVLFQHTGKTLQGINFEKNGLRLERNEIYQMVNGFNVFSMEVIKNKGSIWGEVIGHVVFDQKSAFSIKSQFDFQIAELFYTS
jgi:glycosyltransferase involved in cell wall biosynthesis